MPTPSISTRSSKRRATSMSSIPRHGPRLRTSSALYNELNASAIALMLLYLSSGRRRSFSLVWCDDCLVDFAYQKSFQAAHRLFFGFAFCGASVDVGDGGFV